MVTTEQIKSLREETGISVMQCKKALEEAGGDRDKAILILQKKGRDIAAKKSERNLGAGSIATYVHANGNVSAMVELSAETDFVAKHDDFKQLARDLAMQVAATNPEFVTTAQISEADKARVAELFTKEVEESGKPADIKEKMLAGKLDAYFKERTLLLQPFVKNPDMTVQQLIDGAVQKFGENIEVARFVRYSVSGQ